MPLRHIIYLSRLKNADESLIKGILQTALWHNPRNNITGMMLYADGDVLQVLEGAPEDINPLFARIQCDPRHTDAFVVLDEALPGRHFPNWSMGYRKIGPAELQDFRHYQEVFQGSRESIHTRARRGVATDVITAFSAWAMG